MWSQKLRQVVKVVMKRENWPSSLCTTKLQALELFTKTMVKYDTAIEGSIELPETTTNYPKTTQTTVNIYAYIGLFAHLYWCSLFLNLWLNLHNVFWHCTVYNNTMCSPCHFSPMIKFYPWIPVGTHAIERLLMTSQTKSYLSCWRHPGIFSTEF